MFCEECLYYDSLAGRCILHDGCAYNDMDCEKCIHSYFEEDDRLRCDLKECKQKY